MNVRYKTIEIEVMNHVGILWLNRPEIRNALNDDVLSELGAALTAMEKDTGVRAVPYHAGLEDTVRHRHQDAFLLSFTRSLMTYGLGRRVEAAATEGRYRRGVQASLQLA